MRYLKYNNKSKKRNRNIKQELSHKKITTRKTKVNYTKVNHNELNKKQRSDGNKKIKKKNKKIKLNVMTTTNTWNCLK